MQTFNLPRQITRGAALASPRLCGAKTRRRPPLARRPTPGGERRRRSRRLTRDAVPLGRRHPNRDRAVPGACGPPNGHPLVAAVQRMRGDYPMWGKARIAVLLRRDGHAVSESTTGRILHPGLETRNCTQRQALPRQALGRHALSHRSHHRSMAAPRSRPISRPNASAAASTCSNSRHARPNATATSSATTAPGDTSSTPHGACPTTTSTTSTAGSTPSPTNSTPSDLTRPLADIPPPSTLPNNQLKKPSRLICIELGRVDEFLGD